MNQASDIINDLKDTLQTVAETESATCKLCGHVVRGTSFGEIFQRLGVHGERMHSGYFVKQEEKQ